MHFWNFAGRDYYGNSGNSSLFHLLSALPHLSFSRTEVRLHAAFTLMKYTVAPGACVSIRRPETVCF